QKVVTLPERRFRLLARGDVRADAVHAQRLAGGVIQHPAPAVHPANAPIRTDAAIFGLAILDFLESATDRLEDLVPVLGMDALQKASNVPPNVPGASPMIASRLSSQHTFPLCCAQFQV